jgi:hypothetical protein
MRDVERIGQAGVKGGIWRPPGAQEHDSGGALIAENSFSNRSISGW